MKKNQKPDNLQDEDFTLDEEERRLMRNAEIVRTMPDNIAEVLMKARKQPVWCSDVRWRMELARRQRRYLHMY